MVSASELNPAFREFCECNYPGRFQHMYQSIEDQVRGTGICCLCQGSSPSRLLGACQPQTEFGSDGTPDMMTTGSPCNPFSVQRTGRFSTGDVESHKQFEVTHTSTIDLVKKHEPKLWVFEQVMGFTMPIDKTTKTTPKDQFLISYGGARLS